MLYARVDVRKRSGLGEGVVATPDPVAERVDVDGAQGWIVSDQGLADRQVTVQKEGTVSFKVELPPVPTGSMVEPARKSLLFEIVK